MLSVFASDATRWESDCVEGIFRVMSSDNIGQNRARNDTKCLRVGEKSE